ncbi:TetR/AcrR family transcriptional regulator [Allofranklinella schreckenbergeri]|uniref:TetR/AcrR family transcriptional regulator n=1 Tax=Allofranklinella schreckenbergeri TaxID=1076744 RepID=A0A3M6Q9G9_9BURK|nr:TetR/AcrR family transcriptional regulator [Allofranklinella schreckenbergeri]RMW99048.1 TetR/AcrR family transcriptional regulator [Allofranklinella schreckenbergeri]RRD41900.1 TetR/AcrR family transcriptional regulator [Comamonadaceae bacterium OH3737_COT-264]
MTTPEAPNPRGRPRTITRERIAQAGMGIGLPHITFVGVAAALGVSHMALYKHVANLEELKRLVAEEIFSRWQIPSCEDSHDLPAYLVAFTASIQAFVQAHPGITPYVIRRMAATPSMLSRIEQHQRQVASRYGIGHEQARRLLATIAFHAFAAADTVYTATGRHAMQPAIEQDAETAELEHEFTLGMQALITGALLVMQVQTPASL